MSLNSKRRKIKWRLFLRFLLSLAATLLTLAAVEIGLRVLGSPQFLEPHSEPPRFAFTNTRADGHPVYLNYPGRITFRYDSNPRGYFDANDEVHHDVNPTGFRGPAFTPKPADTFRMVFLGDSFTFGEGVHNHDTYPEVAARLLRKDGRRTESCNLGVGGYNTTQAANVLKLFGFDLDPDVVILGYTLNDAEPPLFQVDPKTGQPVRRAREARIEAEGAPQKPPDSPLYRLRLARMVWQFRRQRHLTKQTIDYYQSMHAPDNPGRIESERALREIISQCRERGIPCVVVMFPLMYNLSDDYPFAGIHQRIGQVVAEAGGRFIDLLPALKDQNARKLIVHPTDQHPNEKAHAAAGKLVAEDILKMPTMTCVNPF
ncbi:MAG: SGNH/GDSL hydrolase family protein [Lentisphaeria bacterium]|nr:SGNH/GDSL hydrolase family protein [Lentisphaeria bacterium]